MDISDLTLGQKVGQMILPGFQGNKINDNVVKMIKEYHAGNIILFTRNISSSEQVFKLNRELQTLALEENNVPLFIASDEEGGSVSRINNTGYFFPGAMTLSSGGNSEDAFKLGGLLGSKLASLGINMNLAPVLDISTNPAHPTLNSRAYSDNPYYSSEMAEAFIKGLQAQNIIAVAKHFPGHGHSNVDTHLEKDSVRLEKKKLREIELIPFNSVIQSGIKGLMSSHVKFSAYDSQMPATLSRNILTKLLREELKFNGLILSDCLQMDAVAKYFGTAESAVMAVNAGVDIIIVSHSMELQINCIKRLIKAVHSGEIKEERIDEAVTRILNLKNNLRAKEFIKSECDSDKDALQNRKLAEFAEPIYNRSISIIKGAERFPVKKENTLFIYTEAVNLSLVDDSKKISISEAVKNKFPEFSLEYFPADADDTLMEKILSKAVGKAQVIMLTYNAYNNPRQVTLVKNLFKITENLIVISMRNPYDILKFPEVPAYAIAYEYTPPAMKSVVKLLSGEISGNRSCPVKLEGITR